MVDNSVLKEAGKLQMALRPAVELSYLSEAEQTALLEVMEGEIRTPSHTEQSPNCLKNSVAVWCCTILGSLHTNKLQIWRGVSTPL